MVFLGGRRVRRGLQSLAVVAALGVMASGCEWREVGYGSEHRRHNTVEKGFSVDNVDSLEVVWSSLLPRPDRPTGTATEPIVADGRVYVSRSAEGADGGIWVSARDAGTGAVVWDRELVAGNTTLAWAVPNARSGDVLSAGYTGLVNGQCTAASAVLDPDTGAGTPVVDGLQVSPPVTAGSVVVTVRHRISTAPTGPCQNSGIDVVAQNAASGDVLWSATDTTPLPAAASFYESFLPAIAGGRVFVAWGTSVHAYSLEGCAAATCGPVWSVDLGIDVTSTTPPVVTEDGHVLVISQEGDLVALAADDGAEQWRAAVDYVPSVFGVDGRPGVSTAGDVIYVTTSANNVGAGADKLAAFAADGCGAAVCEPLWTADLPVAPGNPAIAGDVVFVGAGEAVQGYAADGCGTTTCPPLVTVPIEGGFASDLTVAAGKVFAVTSHQVHALAPATTP